MAASASSFTSTEAAYVKCEKAMLAKTSKKAGYILLLKRRSVLIDATSYYPTPKLWRALEANKKSESDAVVATNSGIESTIAQSETNTQMHEDIPNRSQDVAELQLGADSQAKSKLLVYLKTKYIDDIKFD